MTQYLGCMLCGVRREAAESNHCFEDAKRLGIALIPDFGKEYTHIWTEMFVTEGWPYGKGLVEDLLGGISEKLR